MNFKDFYYKHLKEAQEPTGFWGKRGAGVLVYCSATKRFLLGLRSKRVNEPNTWGLFGGAIDGKESANTAAIRELDEEIGYRGEVLLRTLDIFRTKGFEFHNFLGIVPEEFRPRLDWENADAQWFHFSEFPPNLHFGLKRLINKIGGTVMTEECSLFTESVNLDLDQAFNVFQQEYQNSTGNAWEREKFMKRAHNWNFYGDMNGFIAIRPQKSGFYKLVATAGSPKSKYKGLMEVSAMNLPLWGLVSGDIRDMLLKRGFKAPNFLEQQMLKQQINSSVFGDAEIVNYEKGGGIRLRYPDVGEVTKYFVGSPEYWKKVYSMKGLFGSK